MNDVNNIKRWTINVKGLKLDMTGVSVSLGNGFLSMLATMGDKKFFKEIPKKYDMPKKMVIDHMRAYLDSL